MAALVFPDATVFTDAAIRPDTKAFNADLVRKLASLPDPWSFPAAVVRERRAQGLGPIPLAPKSPRAETVVIKGPGGDLALRVIAPRGQPRGVYLHLHGGGWTLGAADQQDPQLERGAAFAGFVAVSVDYRLAPEQPYPAGPDDCEAAALWLVQEGARRFGTSRFAIGGESAGAHLAVVTMLRLRDRHGLTPFRGANLVAGCYDLALTPSAAGWGNEKLVINTRDIRMFVRSFLSNGGNLLDADVSPLRANLAGLPPALFTVGTRDPLLDDTLFLAARWAAAGLRAELAVYPGGCHAFTLFDCGIAVDGLARSEAFLVGLP
ncbi:alpha/beta hydrolase [Blastochloris viridis]|uniref:Acetyl esterase n=1 Tax=Blastochloris viridis TaxID=1079 RepID=A0A0H5BE29_BLAVI|nr:alpha/beta hydrolase [Blastochloris viridis]ALK10688.1 Carboxylesterase NlhH [Blastochloris viridis]BAR99349.1 esterase/lipase/thioesterase [Blastochloris viridis]CUU43351.1 Acetyl esterase [Blastochloris viridis]